MKNIPTQKMPLILYTLLIAFAGFYLTIPFQLIFYFLAAIVWYLATKREEGPAPAEEQGTEVHIPSWLIPLALIALIVIAISPYLTGHPAPLGYDTGIYKQEFNSMFTNLPDFDFAIHPGLFFFTDFLHLLGIQTSFLLKEGYILLYILLGLSIYSVTKEYSNKQAAIIALIIFVLSRVQFTAYTFILYKNILGLSILLFSLILIKRRSYLLLPAGLFLAILQPTHFVLFGLTLFTLWIWNWKDKKDRHFFLINGSIILGLALSILALRPHLISTAFDIIQKKDSLSSGVFITVSKAIKTMILYLPLALVGLIFHSKSDKKPLLIITIVTAIIVFLRFFFFQRYFIELDIFLIIFAGIGLATFIRKIFADKHHKQIFMVFILLILVSHTIYIAKYKPWISQSELKQIQALCETTETDAYVMATHSYYSPWLYGYSCRDTFAPGLFSISKWDQPTWGTFWNGSQEQRENLMNKTFASEGRPVYIFVGENQQQMNFSGHIGFTKLSDKLWKWEP